MAEECCFCRCVSSFRNSGTLIATSLAASIMGRRRDPLWSRWQRRQRFAPPSNNALQRRAQTSQKSQTQASPASWVWANRGDNARRNDRDRLHPWPTENPPRSSRAGQPRCVRSGVRPEDHIECHVFECHVFGVCDRTGDQPPMVRRRRWQTELAKPPLRRIPDKEMRSS
jgi:hypothetical protein